MVIETENFFRWRGGKTWYHIASELTPDSTPIIVINGGPGCSSDYCQPFDDLSDIGPVIRYDQIETGRSDRPNNPDHWTFESYIEELEALISQLGISKYHLLGHSWGSMLALEYLKVQRPHIKSVVLAACMWDIPWYNRECDKMLKQISPIGVIRARQLEAAGQINHPEYKALDDAWFKTHLYRGDHYPAWAEAHGGYNNGPYHYMWGPSEFVVNGTFKNWSARAWMPSITTPTLVISGEYDEVTPEQTREAAQLIPGAQAVILPGLSHLAHIEQPDAVLGHVRKFLEMNTAH